MKKVTILVGTAHADETLAVLRALGVLHVRLQGQGARSCAEIEQKIERVTTALSKIGSVDEPETLIRMPDQVVDEILELAESRERLLVSREELDGKLAQYRKWSNVSLQAITELGEAGVKVRLFRATRSQYQDLVDTHDLYRVGQEGRTVLLAHIAVGKEHALDDLQEECLPDERRRDLLDAHYRVDEALVEHRAKLAFLGNYRMVLEEYAAQLKTDLEFSRVEASLADDRGISYLQGFAPADALDPFRAAAEENGWAYSLEEPDEDEEVPTLVRNPKWIRIIDPVMAFLGTIPGYNELDISLWFLVFFALFVAMLIGDAGYGLIYLGVTMLARRKFRKAPAEPFILMYVLSAATILWGVLSGTWFGSETIANIPFFAALVIPAISSFDLTKGGFNDNQFLLIGLCFKIGAVHLTLAHALAAAKESNSPKAIAEIGWISIIWGLYCLTGSLVLGQPFPPLGGWLIGVGSGLVLLFANFQKNVLKGVGATLVEFPLALIGGFSDVVSYLRLFAVGYTSLVLASSFNQMALGDGVKGPLAAIGAALILLLGHSLNLVLAGMGVVVHGIRLKMLEFSGHVGNEWSGTEYRPFREERIAPDGQ